MEAFTITSDQLLQTLGIELWRVPIVVFSSVVIYLVFLLLVRIFGARVLSGLTGFDMVVGVMLGAVAGRVVLGHPPTLTAGIIGLVTLLCCEALFGIVRKHVGVRRAVNAQPTVVLAHGRPQADLMRKTHVSHEDIVSCLRRAGIGDPAQVLCIVLEPSGAMSVLRTSTPFDPVVLRGVLGAERVVAS
ncbi:hypothetical protein GCM10022261_12560 [Brevibacterium daeguense]|uniref:YetF C-terminal domain-containing protein n=1 Tax=Brevibacterium daeguense TaxID=909936 RepID=A0ABP8EIL3_9MICO|nr:YetF domain-containing protein [Brevibacterium daeguense]